MGRTLAMLVLGLVVVFASRSTHAAGSQARIPKEWQNKLQNSPDDANHNQVDDVLEAMPSTQHVDVLVDLTGCVGTAERTRLTVFGTIDFEATYFPILHMTNVLVSNLVSLAADPIVAFVEEDSWMYHTLAVSNPAIQVKASSAYPPPPPPGAPITVREKFPNYFGNTQIVVIDTGVDDQSGPGVTHEALPRFDGGLRCPAFPPVCLDEDPDDTVGTGTHGAAIALGKGEGLNSAHEGIAPEEGLYDVKVTPDPTFPNPRIPRSSLVVALDAIMKKMDLTLFPWTPRIAYLPWSTCYPSNGTDGVSVAVNALVDRGLLVVTGMQNCSTCLGNPRFPGASCPYLLPIVPSPAAADLALVVGASDDQSTVSRADDTLSPDSLRGPRLSDGDADANDELKPDLVAPGVNIESAQFNTVSGYVNRSGTSMAAAHVAGCAALVLQLQNKFPLEVKADLIGTVDPHGVAGWDAGWGHGILNCFQAVDHVNDGLCADLRFTPTCGPPPLPGCHYHPGLHAQDWLVEGVDNTFLADIKNDGPGFANPYKVEIGMDYFSNHDDKHEICTLDMPVLAPGATAQASCHWKPKISGDPPGVVEACIYGRINSDDDCSSANNSAQHNEQIQQAWSPAVATMKVENPTQETLTMELQGSFNCNGGACAGWAFTPSSNNFLKEPDECATTVTLQATPGLGAVREAKLDVFVVGHAAGGETRDLGAVTLVARLACATSNLRFTSKTNFMWNGPTGFSSCPSSTFDVARGSLPIAKYNSVTLRGNFSTGTCLANDISMTQASDSSPLPPGAGYWYLSRVGGTVPGSWDTHDAKQKGIADDTLKTCQ